MKLKKKKIKCILATCCNSIVSLLKVLWLVLRFFLLATELSVIVFGIAFGKYGLSYCIYSAIRQIFPSLE